MDAENPSTREFRSDPEVFEALRAIREREALALLAFGCTLRVSCEVLAYQRYAARAWRGLPASALLELTALTVFATNMLCTFVSMKTHAVNEPLMVGSLATVSHPR